MHAILGHLLDSFLLSAVPLATDSERQRNSNPRKLYPADPGLIKAFDASGRSNLGHALETAVLNELETRARELRALTAAAKDHPRATRRLLGLDRDARATAAARGIEILPAYEWPPHGSGRSLSRAGPGRRGHPTTPPSTRQSHWLGERSSGRSGGRCGRMEPFWFQNGDPCRH